MSVTFRLSLEKKYQLIQSSFRNRLNLPQTSNAGNTTRSSIRKCAMTTNLVGLTARCFFLSKRYNFRNLPLHAQQEVVDMR